MILLVTVLLISSYGLREVGKNEVFTFALVLCSSKLVLLHQVSDVNVINGAHRSLLFNENTHFSLPLSAQSRRRGGLALFYDIFLLNIVDPCNGFLFHRDINAFHFFSDTSS